MDYAEEQGQPPSSSSSSSSLLASQYDLYALLQAGPPRRTTSTPSFGAHQTNPGGGPLIMEADGGDLIGFTPHAYNWAAAPPTSTMYYNTAAADPPGAAAFPTSLFSNYHSAPPPPAGSPSAQIQALRDFMAYGGPNNPAAPGGSPLFYPFDDPAADAARGSPPSANYHPRGDVFGCASSERGHRSQFQRESHILAERQRREEMNEKFSALRAMIPKATKKDKASIVGDTINYVLELERRLKQLQACKKAGGAAAKASRKRKTPPTVDISASMGPWDDPSRGAIDLDASTADNTTKPRPVGAPNGLHQVPVVGPGGEGAWDDLGVSSPSEQSTEESKLRPGRNPPAEVDVQRLGPTQAVIKIVCARRAGHVLRVLHALEACKVDVVQSNVMTAADYAVHFVTVQLEEGVSAGTEELVSVILQAVCPDLQG